MDAGFDHICLAKYGEFESFLGYKITYIGSMSTGYPAKKVMLGLFARVILYHPAEFDSKTGDGGWFWQNGISRLLFY